MSQQIEAQKKKKEILDAVEILGRKSTLYNKHFKRIFAKKSQLHCTEVLCLRPLALKRLKLNLGSQAQSDLHV